MGKKTNNLRIIGGEWRSRRVQFNHSPKIRPTPDRVRETLFNWLSTSIVNARCLDLFAGSGVLGFEAASRGAIEVTLVDDDAAIIESLNHQKKLLTATQVQIIHQDAMSFLRQAEQAYDILFLDPPFNSELHRQALSVANERKLLKPSSLIYVETSAQSNAQNLQGFNCLREKNAGEVHYALYEVLH